MRDFVLWIARVYNDLMGQRTNTAKLNWHTVHNVGSYNGIIEHSLSDRACVRGSSTVSVTKQLSFRLGQCIEHRLYVFYQKKNNQKINK